MENIPLRDTPQIPTKKNSPRPLLVFVIIGSLLGGAAAGGAVSYYLTDTSSGQALVNRVDDVKTVQVEEESATVGVVSKVNAAVVSIVASRDYSDYYNSQTMSPFDQFFFGTGQQSGNTNSSGQQEVCSGSGFIVRSDGLIVTNNHVICDDEASYSVVMNDGKKYDAKIVAQDSANDIAVIKIEAKDLTVLSLGDSDKVQIGQTVIAIGNALGEYHNTVTKGVISAKSRTITASDSSGQSETLENVFQTDASINQGNSGGPLIDLTGAVIGINTAIDQQGTLIGFAIPINVVKNDIDSVVTTGKITQPYLGVRYVEVTELMASQNKLPVTYGALLQKGSGKSESAVVSGSPADKAGLKENDIITAINGTELKDDHTLTSLLAKYKPGDQIELTYYHQGEKKTVKVTLGEKT